MTTSYFYSYIETTSYQTTYTITIKARQSRYSLTGEWWESNDGRNWYKVDSVFGRRNGHWDYYGSGGFSWHWDCSFSYPPPGSICRSAGCANIYCSQQAPPAVCFEPHQGWWQGCPSSYPQLLYSLTVNQGPVLLYLATPSSPRIFYYRTNESLVVNVGITSYTVSGRTESCYDVWDPNGSYCVRTITEWGRRHQFQAIELIDWDTGEVYASLNQTSVTFNINANTIVRFKYVLVDSWSRTWEVILQPPPPTPNECQQILNDPNKVGSLEWCRCASLYDPDAYNERCKQSCLYVAVSPCCTGDTSSACLDSWSGQGGQQCKIFSSGTQTLSARWSASWSLKSGWTYHDIGKVGPGTCYSNRSGNSASGTCSVDAEPNRGYHVNVIVIFKKTQ